MSENTVFSQPAFILRQQHYRESSLIIDVFTRDYGRFGLIAKGVRKAKSKTLGILRPFTCLALSFAGKSKLKTVTGIELLMFPIELNGLRLYSGFYMNELLCHFLHTDDPHPDVFLAYQDCLTQMTAHQSFEAALRVFELNLMENIGYGINLSYDLRNNKPIQPALHYHFNSTDGLVEDLKGPFSGAALMAMERRDFADPNVLTEAKHLMRTVIDNHLQGKQLKSRAVMNAIVKRL